MTIEKIEQFRQWAKTQGKTDAEINAFINSKLKTDSETPFAPRIAETQVVEEPKKDGAVKGFFKGVAKGVGSTVANVSSTGQRVLDKISKPIAEKVSGKESPNLPTAIETFGEDLKPKTNAEKAGFVTEQVAEFFIPGAAAPKAATKVSKIGNIAARTGREVINAGVVTSAQGGSVKDVVTSAGITAAVPIVGKVADIVTKPARKVLAERIAPGLLNKYILRPVARDFHFGKDPGLGVAKEGLTANTREGLLKAVVNKKKVIGQEIDTLLTRPGVATKKIDVTPALRELDDDIAKAAESGEELLYNRLVKIREGITGKFQMVEGRAVKVADRSLIMSPLDAAKLKRRIGNTTKWTGQAFDNEANQARVNVYRAINSLIDDAAPGSKALNSRYANLLTAEKALDNTINVAKRQYPFGLINAGLGATAAGASMVSGDSAPEAIAKGLLFATGAKAIQSTAVQSRLAKALAKLSPQERESISRVLPTLRNILLGANSASEDQDSDTEMPEQP